MKEAPHSDNLNWLDQPFMVGAWTPADIYERPEMPQTSFNQTDLEFVPPIADKDKSAQSANPVKTSDPVAELQFKAPPKKLSNKISPVWPKPTDDHSKLFYNGSN